MSFFVECDRNIEEKELMDNYNYEFVRYDEGYSAKIFITSVEHSKFHWHYEYEFVFVVKGSVKVNIVPNPIVLQEGQFVLLNSKLMHEVQKTEKENIILFVQISPELFQLDRNTDRIVCFHIDRREDKIEEKETYVQFTRKIALLGYTAEKQRKDKKVRFRTKALLYDLIADCFDIFIYDIRQNSVNTNESENNRLEMLIHYVEENFQNEYVLQTMSSTLGLSEKSIHRQLKSGIGLSARELVAECRIKEARKMLKYTDKPISLIANLVGFNSDKTFYRIFKQQMGMTPNEYRKEGERLNADTEIKGYLGTNWRETTLLLEKHIKGYNADDRDKSR